MSKTATSILERVQEMTRQAREREAEKLMTLALVKEAISEAAKQGYSRAVIAPVKPLDLTKTDRCSVGISAILPAKRFLA